MHSPTPGPSDTAAEPKPLTEAQIGLWYAQRLDPENPIYNTGQYVDIHGPLDVEALRVAVNQALAESDGLAIRIIGVDDEPFQIVDEASRPQLRVIDLQFEAVPDHAAHRWMQQDISTPLDPAKDPMAVEVLFVLGAGRYLWYQRIHHLVIDGYGVALLTSRICDLYAATLMGRPPKTSPLASFDGVLAEDAAYLQSSKRVTDREFWIKQFKHRPDVVSLKPGLAVTAHGYLRRGRELSTSFGIALGRLAETIPCAWPDVVVGLIAAYLGRHSGESEVIVGVPTMNRMGSVSARVPAMIMNVLPIRVRIDEDVPLKRFLIDASRQLSMARRHGRYRSEQLRRDLALLGEHRRLHGALINVLPFAEPPALPGVTASLHTLGTGAVDDLTITVRADSAGSSPYLELDANPNLYSDADVAEHLDRLRAFLETAVQADTLSTVPTLTPAEHHRWVYAVNDTTNPIEEATLSELIERTTERLPASPALTFDLQTMSYAELYAQTTLLAARLRASGVRRGEIVAVALPRSPDLVVALVAILRAGGAYLPVDLEHPPARLAAIFDSARPRLAITFTHLRNRLPESIPVVFMDEPLPDGTSAVSAELFEAPHPDDPAYVIYTSGSTGEPKGVVIQHRAIVNRLEWMRTHYGITQDDRILQKTPATFDVSVWEFFLPLIAGATLVLAPPDAHKDPVIIASILREQRISTAHFVPSMLTLFLSEPAASGIEMRRVFCSGEALPAQLRDRFHEVVRAELHNLYGPTEAAVDVTYWPATPEDHSIPVPIGFPVWNTRLYVLDDRQRPLPPGVTGHLFIAGVQLAREYLGRPDLTSDRFIADPFHEGERMYRTGDLARWRTGGALIFVGRADHQIKIRGFRVELGEIEAAILSSGAIGQAVVIAWERLPGDQRLAAYVTPRESNTAVGIEDLKTHVAGRVPDYMVPSSFTILSELPVTSSGKTDRAALPSPEFKISPEGRPPATPTELRVAELFEEILGVKAGAEDDFFLLGGHSLLAVRLMALVRKRWNCELSLGVLFANTTVARMAARLDADAGAVNVQSPETEGLGMIIPLVSAKSSALAPLFCIHPAGGISWCYSGLARSLVPQRPVYGVQAQGLDLSMQVPDRLTAMADGYVEQIRRVYPTGPYHLAGWSVGGIIAQAMAVRLRAMGATVGVVAMLDSYPSDCWRNEPEPDESAALKALLYIAGHDPETIGSAPLTRESVVSFLRRSGHPLGELSDDALTGIVRVVENTSGLVRRHYHERFDGPLLYFRAALDHQNDNLSPLLWQPYVGSLQVYDIPALHSQMVGPEAASSVAKVLSAQLNTCKDPAP